MIASVKNRKEKQHVSFLSNLCCMIDRKIIEDVSTYFIEATVYKLCLNQPKIYRKYHPNSILSIFNQLRYLKLVTDQNDDYFDFSNGFYCQIFAFFK